MRFHFMATEGGADNIRDTYIRAGWLAYIVGWVGSGLDRRLEVRAWNPDNLPEPFPYLNLPGPSVRE